MEYVLVLIILGSPFSSQKLAAVTAVRFNDGKSCNSALQQAKAMSGSGIAYQITGFCQQDIAK